MPTENQIVPSPRRPLAASLTSRVVLDHEDPEEFRALHQLHTDRFLPRDVVEINLVDRMVVAQWRIDRIRIVHSAELQRRFNKNSPANGPHAQLAESFIDQARLSEFATLDAHEARLERSYDRALRTLQQFREKELKFAKRTQEVVENKPELPDPPIPEPEPEPPSPCLCASVVEENPLPDTVEVARHAVFLHESDSIRFANVRRF